MNNVSAPVEKNIKSKDEKSPVKVRALALDALRGLSILLMVLSAAIPYGVLPSWMYHAQIPPPDHIFNPNLPGITWVDLIFPFFLFTMGAAIPLSLTNKLQKKNSIPKIVLSLLNRSLLLAAFAIYIHHINPGVIRNNPNWETWLLSLSGFALLFPVLMRLPQNWGLLKIYSIRIIGFFCTAIFLIFLSLHGQSGFSVNQSDIIILVLANVAFFGGVIWLVSRDNILLRLAFMGLLIALRLSSTTPGWIFSIWNSSPVPWLFEVRYLQYLFIIIPGTIVGDFIISSMNSRGIYSKQLSTNRNLVLISLILILINILVVIGLKARAVFEILPGVLLLCFFCWLLIKKSFNNENLPYKIFGWGVCWLILGFLFEPYEGGIKKDYPTLSYYFITTGLAVFVLIVFQILIEIMNKKKSFSILIECGQNPLIAYAGINNLVYPILFLLHIKTLLDSVTALPWLGVLQGILITYLVALSTRIFTNKKIFLRA